MRRLSLHVPRLTEMEYRQRLLAQPETMGYNRGRGFAAEGYHPDTGCIDFPPSDWRYWRQVWLMNEPDFFSALLRDNARNRFVGETCYYRDGTSGAHVAGILIEARWRGRGYCAEGLALLAGRAFRWPEVDLLRCDLPEDAAAALRGYRRAGFHEYGLVEGCRTLILTREDYERMAIEDGMGGE